MESRMGFELWLVLLVIVAAYLFLVKKRRGKLPPGPLGVPLFGYVPFLGKDPYLELQRLGKKYGSVYGLDLGMTYTVVVTDYNIAKELFKQYTTSDRPPNLFHLMPGGVGFGELNGSEWLEQRRYTIQTLKNLRFGGSNWEKLIEMELCTFLDRIADNKGRPIDIHKSLFANISNNILSLVSGQTSRPMDILQSGVEGFIQTHDQSGYITLFPKLYRFLIKLGIIKHKKELNAMTEMNNYLRDHIQGQHTVEENSYVQEYLQVVEKNRETNSRKSFTVRNLIGNVQALIIAGSDTTTESLMWLLLAMAAYPHVQDLVHQEIDHVLGKDELTKWEDRTRLPYCHAAILEAQRWRSVAPLNLLHIQERIYRGLLQHYYTDIVHKRKWANQDVSVGDYVIPKGSCIMALTWAFHMDPEKWQNPEDFRPERFFDDKGSVVKDIDNFAPFSFGKRLCIGETIAYTEIFLYFVSIMQRFRVLPEKDGQTPDLSGNLGIVLQPATRKLRFVSRAHESIQ